MRKIFVTMLLFGSAVAAFAQGTVWFSNNAFEKISFGWYGTPVSTWTVVPATANLINFGLFYGTGAAGPASLTFLGSVSGVNSATSAGLIVNQDGNPVRALQIPDTSPGQINVWIQVTGWSSSFGTDWAAAQAAAATTTGDWFGVSPIINVAANAGGLGPQTGPGAIIWQSIAGTDPNRIHGFALYTALGPEPSSTALFGLGAAALLIFHRRT